MYLQENKQCIFFFRDTGISLQIQLYQLYSEIFVFLIYIFSGILFLFVNPINTIFVGNVIQSVIQSIVYVVQPLFYLHGDPSFRQSCINLGIWHALKRSLPVCPKVALEAAPKVGPEAVGPEAVGPRQLAPRQLAPSWKNDLA